MEKYQIQRLKIGARGIIPDDTDTGTWVVSPLASKVSQIQG